MIVRQLERAYTFSILEKRNGVCGEIAEKSKMSVCDWIEQQQEIMEKRSNHYGIHVELRCQWADYILVSIMNVPGFC